MGDTEVRAKIVATDQTGPAFESAKEGVDGLTEHMENGFARVAERLAEFFAVEKIAEFVKSSVTEFAALERQFDVLKAVVNSNGESWDKWKATVDDFLASEESVYGFTKEQLMNALTNAETKVHDMGAALKITDEAEKLSILTHKSLQRSVDAIALAYEGNTSGLTQLGTKLGLTLAQSKDAKTVFDALAKATAGIGAAADDTQGQINKMAAAWEDTKENLGETLAPLLSIVTFLENAFTSLLDELIALANFIDDIIVPIFQAWLAVIETLGKGLVAVGQILTGHLVEGFHTFVNAAKGGIEGVKSSFSNATSMMGADWDKMAGQMDKTWYGHTNAVSLMSDKLFAKQAVENSKRALEDEKSTKKHLDTKLKMHAEHNKAVGKLDDQAAQAKADLDAALTTNASKLASTLIGMEKSKNKEVAALAKDVALARAIMNTATGISGALSDYPYPASLAVGALVAAEGAIEIAQIEGVALAKGGVVMGPTHVLAGEGGEPEAVVPLSKLPSLVQAMPSRGPSGAPITIHVHGVQNAAQFVNQLPGHLQRAQTRLGNRLAALT